MGLSNQALHKYLSLNAIELGDIAQSFYPAKYAISEWKEYFVEIPGITQLRVGHEIIDPVNGNVFRIKFENQIGMTSLQPIIEGEPSDIPIFVEVVSNKFPDPVDHLAFFKTLVDDLYAKSVRLPFSIQSDTSRNIQEAFSPPTPLFTLHFILQNFQKILSAIQIILLNPHRLLTEYSDFVPLSAVKEADEAVLLDIIQTPQELIKTNSVPVSTRLNGYAPIQVWQRIPVESVNSIENQFCKFFIGQLGIAIENIKQQPWWLKLSHERQTKVIEISSFLQQTLTNHLFEEVEDLRTFPVASRTLMNRDGYRDIFILWQQFQSSRRPIFGKMKQAIDVRDIATLYEIWVFYALIEEIQIYLATSPRLRLDVSDDKGLNWKAKAIFEGYGSLVYNQGFHKASYSVPLRPDYSWSDQSGKIKFVFDAKFKMTAKDLINDESEVETIRDAKLADLYKMHTYRDALGLDAAISVFPGNQSNFYLLSGEKISKFSIKQVFTGELSGIGAYALSPIKI